jgi:hypothetical protein
MTALSPILYLFDYLTDSLEVSEDFSELKAKFSLKNYKEILSVDLDPIKHLVNARDELLISISVGGGEPIDCYLNVNEAVFFDELSTAMSIRENELIEVTLLLTKKQNKGTLSVYCPEEFILYLQCGSLSGLLYDFYGAIAKDGTILFEYQTTGPFVSTSTIQFSSITDTKSISKIDREKPIKNAKSVCHFNYLSKYNILPEDFSINRSDSDELKRLFDRLSTVLSIAFLFDITTIDENVIASRLNGYKSISINEDWGNITDKSASEYFSIYQWVYGSGSLNDKLGLARNIISLHLEDTAKIELKGLPYSSIQSSFIVYQKQNIKQYIEIRNKISDQLVAFHDRANKIIDGFASGFQKSALALVTFYISAVILKVLKQDTLVNVFSIDAAILSTGFIVCSGVYYFVSKWEVNAQRSRFIESYENMKERYKDLLDDQDINRILRDDKDFGRDLDFIDNKGKRYSLLWFFTLGIFLIATWGLYIIYHPDIPQSFLNWFYNHFGVLNNACTCQK